MATSSFDKTITITKKKAVNAIIKHLQTPCSTPAIKSKELKIASEETLAKKVKKR